MILKYALVFLLLFATAEAAEEEIALYNASGKPVAYVAVDDELTIYLWSGTPVAYLDADKSGGGFHVYGFNGKHLGWFVRGVVRDHEGTAACAVKEQVKSPQSEPFKSFKQFKPFRAFEEFAPFRPTFSNSFGDTPCSLFLAAGKA